MVDSSNKSIIEIININTNKSTVVRKNEQLKKEIENYVKKAERPLSTSDLTILTKKAWHTIDRTCLKLQIEGKIDGFKIGKMNLWRVK